MQVQSDRLLASSDLGLLTLFVDAIVRKAANLAVGSRYPAIEEELEIGRARENSSGFRGGRFDGLP